MKREEVVSTVSASSSGTMITKESGGDAKEPSWDAKEPSSDFNAESDIEKGGAKLVDRYGFYVSDDFHAPLLVSAQEVQLRKEKEAERTTKWIKMIKNWDGVLSTRQEKLKRRVRKGIPDNVRGFVWTKLSESAVFKKKYPKLNEVDKKALDELTEDEIERDIDRTFPRHLQFEKEAEGTSVGQSSLRHILQLYAKTDAEVGYCQGMAFISGLLLTYMPEDDAFYCFLSALQSPKFNLRAMFLPDMLQAQQVLFVFGELGKKHLGKLWSHLEKEGIHHTMYATEWLLTMYCRGFSFDLVTRVWDVFFSEGYKIVYRVALALVKSIEKELLSSSFEDILGTFRSIPKLVDAERLMDLAWTIPLKRAEIELFEKQFAETKKKA